MATFPNEQPLGLLTRSRTGRWLGGVCAGLADGRGTHPGWIRAAFVLAAFVGGLGILVYLACWLIIPQEGEGAGDSASNWLVGLARACGGCIGVVTLGVLAAAATLFGFGWIAVALAAATFLGVLVAWPRLGPAWALLPVAAVALPAAAVASGGVQLTGRVGHITIAPRVLAPGGVATFRAGLGKLMVDLRGTSLPATGTVNVRVVGGVARTIVALPHDRCVHVQLRYDVQPFWREVASQLVGHSPAQGVVLFGSNLPGETGTRSVASPVPGPVLRLDFTSAGGGLYVRDYPDAMSPDSSPDWPGYPVYPEPRPNLTGVPKGLARYELAAWRTRHAAQVRSRALVDSLRPGPCTIAGAPR